MDDGIYVAAVGFECRVDDLVVTVKAGTTVREGHPLMDGREAFFHPLVVDYELPPEPDGKHVAPKKTAAPKLKVGGS